MLATARLIADLDAFGQTRIVEMTECAPLGLRITRDAVYLVGTAQGLVGDDDLELEIVVRQGATLSIRSAAASIAYTSHSARFLITAAVEHGAVLDWKPEPLIVTGGCVATISAQIALARDASLIWHEECLLGRFDEEPGDLDLTVNVDYDGDALVRHQLVLGPSAQGWSGPAGLGDARAVANRIYAGATPRPRERCGEGWAVLHLDGPGAVITALGDDLVALRRKVAEAKQPEHSSLIPSTNHSLVGAL